MENDEHKNFSDTDYSVDNNSSAVNKLILDYYKKFGRKRDIEQFFSLSTAQPDLSDRSSLFWKKMKEQNDSSDSGDKKTGSSTELCRISIKCSMQDPQTSQEYNKNTESDTESPPIISDEVADTCANSDDESNKSDGDHSQKSIDITLDTSINRPHSPTSSITSQRKLEWDSLADVGYANESDRKNSASSLSTLERLALHQQYSNNDAKQISDPGLPTAHSTPLEQTENKSKSRNEVYKKTSRFCKKDVDIMEVNFPNTSDITQQPINVNLTKHISFNVEKDGNITMDNLTKNISISQENVCAATESTPKINIDKEIQTTLPKSNSKHNIVSLPKDYSHRPKLPVLISLNSLKKRNKKKKRKRNVSRQRRKVIVDKENIPQEKSANQESDAESFEYMPGHIYNQNKYQDKNPLMNVADNKSSLESSAGHTTESSKDQKNTFTVELEKSIDLLKLALQHRYKDTSLKKKLIKEVVQSLIKTKFNGDESSNEFLSGLSQNRHTVSSTSDSNNLSDKKPEKSILRTENFNSSAIATTSQSAPNLPTMSNENPIKPSKPVNVSSTDSDLSYKSKYLSEVILANSSSEEIYKKYLMALKKENLYKKQLREKEFLLQQKVRHPDEMINAQDSDNSKIKSNLKHLIKDLTKNNFADGSGDASKLQCPSSSNVDVENGSVHRYRSHSVFTLSSGNTDSQKKNKKLRNRLENEINSSLETSTSVKCHCRCSANKRDKIAVANSSVQVDITNQPKPFSEIVTLKENISKETVQKKSPTRSESSKKESKGVGENSSDDAKYICLCTDESQAVPDNFLIYKCSRLPNKCIMIGSNMQTNVPPIQKAKTMEFYSSTYEKNNLAKKENSILSTQSSQTDFNLPKLLLRNSSEKSASSSSSECRSYSQNKDAVKTPPTDKPLSYICEGTKWAQTEISIDPKISDPSITDIKMIEDECYINLKHEQKGKVSEVSSDHNTNKKDDNKQPDAKHLFVNNKIDQELSVNNLQTNENIVLQYSSHKKDEENQLKYKDSATMTYSEDTQPHNNFVIPIRGTNMTVKVSLGSANKHSTQNNMTKQDKTSNSQESLLSNSVKTFKSDIIENLVCPQEESVKKLQTENVEQKQIIEKPEYTYDQNNDNAKEFYEENKPMSSHYSYDSSGSRRYSTYPKENIPKKPLLRSNTDTGRIESFYPITHTNKKDVDTQYDLIVRPQTQTKATATEMSQSSGRSSNTKSSERSKTSNKEINNVRSSTSNSDDSKQSTSKDPLLDIIHDITKRYSKRDVEKIKRKKRYNDIIAVLNYLLDTGESTDNDVNKPLHLSTSDDAVGANESIHSSKSDDKPRKTFENKSVQLSPKKSKQNKCCIESSDCPISTDIPSTSTDSATCKVLRRLRHECEKYHQKCCKSHSRKCEASSSSSVNCEQCKHVHRCYCRGHKSHRSRTMEKSGKKCIAYNLILQTSDSVASEEMDKKKCGRQLKNIIVKVPSKHKVENMQFKEVVQKIERDLPHNHYATKNYRSRSLPHDKEMSSTDNVVIKPSTYTVRDYLERNRPDFVEKSSKRLHCLKSINEARLTDCDTHLNMIVVHPATCAGNDMTSMYCGGVPNNVGCQCNVCCHNMYCVSNEVTEVATERATKRRLLSVHVGSGAVGALSETELRHLAEEMGRDLRTRKVAPKFISEKDMKKHSEKIYKSLPEVQQKKEEIKKEKIKKTNLLMANIFKKNLQKKTLRGAVNLSNYSAVIKI